MPEDTANRGGEPIITTEAIRQLVDTPLARIANKRAGDPLGKGDVRGFLVELHAVMEEYQTAIDAMRADPVNSAELVTDLQRRIVALHAAGKTVVEIAKDTGSSRGNVHELLNKLNLVPNVRKGQIPELSRRQIINLKRQGVGDKAIAEQTGLTVNQVRTTCRWAARRNLLDYNDGRRAASA